MEPGATNSGLRIVPEQAADLGNAAARRRPELPIPVGLRADRGPACIALAGCLGPQDARANCNLWVDIKRGLAAHDCLIRKTDPSLDTLLQRWNNEPTVLVGVRS